MKRTAFLFLLLFFGTVYGQEPNWVDNSYRESNLPKSDYLVGFSYTTDVSKKEASDELKQLESFTKSRLIESVKVSVKSVSTSNVTDYNGEVEDYFNQHTTSSSELKLVGLQTETYYSKKKKTAYALAYVQKSRMVEYYRSEMGKNMAEITTIISDGKQLLNKGQIKEAYALGVSAFSKFLTISESQKVLMALGATGVLDTRTTEVSELSSAYSRFMKDVTAHPRMRVDDMGYILAIGLTKSANLDGKAVSVSEFSYAQTGLSSEFSYKLKISVEQFVPSLDSSAYHSIRGTFNYQDDRVVVSAKLVDVKTGKVLGRIQVQIPEANLIHANIVVVPSDIQRLEELDQITFTSLTTNAKGKAGLGLDRDLIMIAKMNGNPVSGVPVVFRNNNGGVVYCQTVTGVDGEVHCSVKRISGKYRNQVIRAVLDISRYLDNAETAYVRNHNNNKSLPEATFKVVVMPATVYIRAEENNFGKSLDVKLIEPQLKESLAQHGFVFTQSESEADYVINIRASSRKGGNVSGVYFAYVDVSISVYDVNQGKEVYKESINNVKGGGGTFNQAGGKAFYEAARQAKEKITDILVK